MKNWKKIFIVICIILISQTKVYAGEENTINEQQENFGITDFITKSKEFSGEFFDGIDINEILNNAIKGEVDNTSIYKKILNLFGNEVQSTLKTLISILAIIF